MSIFLIASLAGAMLWPVSSAAGTYVYPKGGQSAEQQEKDIYECYGWAKGQTGHDPMAAQAPPPPRGGAVKGAARGAAVGAVGGAVAGDAGTGAAAGAAAGGLVGGMRQRDAVRQQAGAQQSGRAQYDRAYAACMGGRGYEVQ